MRMIAGALSLSGDLVVLDEDGTMIELDAMWIRRATWWEDAIETAAGITALGAAIAERVGHDRQAGLIVPAASSPPERSTSYGRLLPMS